MADLKTLVEFRQQNYSSDTADTLWNTHKSTIRGKFPHCVSRCVNTITRERARVTDPACPLNEWHFVLEQFVIFPWTLVLFALSWLHCTAQHKVTGRSHWAFACIFQLSVWRHSSNTITTGQAEGSGTWTATQKYICVLQYQGLSSRLNTFMKQGRQVHWVSDAGRSKGK